MNMPRSEHGESLKRYLENSGRRDLLKWTAPVVVSVALPAHAQTTFPPFTGLPLLNAVVPSKCAGPAGGLIAEATLSLVSDGSLMTITAITHNAPAPDTVTIPPLPAVVDGTNGLEISWEGAGTDALTCLPVNATTITVSYRGGLDPTVRTADFSLTAVLAVLT
jgi:hypothetical protein